MARRLRFYGTGSGEGGCPAVHEDLDSREIIVHGTPLTDPTTSHSSGISHPVKYRS